MFKRTHTCGELNKSNVGDELVADQQLEYRPDVQPALALVPDNQVHCVSLLLKSPSDAPTSVQPELHQHLLVLIL